MTNLENKEFLIFYHGGCADGFGAAYSAWKKFGEDASYIPLYWDHVEIPEISQKTAYFLDFCPSQEVIKELKNKKNKVIIIDHHKSAYGSIEEANEYIIEMDNSGAVLAFKYFNPGKEVPFLLKIIEDRDLWKFKLPESEAIDIYLSTLEFDFEAWDNFVQKLEDSKEKNKILETGKTILAFKKNLLKRIISEGVVEVMFEGQEMYAINSPIFESSLGDELSKNKGIAIIWSRNRNALKVSLRSKGDLDVSLIAKKYGGGGHKNASGFSLSKEAPLPWQEIE